MSPTPKYIEDVLSENHEKESDKVFPYKITRVDDETNRDLLKYFTGIFLNDIFFFKNLQKLCNLVQTLDVSYSHILNCYIEELKNYYFKLIFF